MLRLCGEENDEVRHYVLTKPLQRPKTNAFTMILIFSAFFAVLTVFCIVMTLYTPFRWYIKLSLSVFFVIGFSYASAKFILIKSVECYQHYAKEETRRRCLCMPTCSEYAILTLKKYPLPVALRKIRIRLFFTCDGGIYIKDFP